MQQLQIFQCVNIWYLMFAVVGSGLVFVTECHNKILSGSKWGMGLINLTILICEADSSVKLYFNIIRGNALFYDVQLLRHVCI